MKAAGLSLLFAGAVCALWTAHETGAKEAIFSTEAASVRLSPRQGRITAWRAVGKNAPNLIWMRDENPQTPRLPSGPDTTTGGRQALASARETAPFRPRQFHSRAGNRRPGLDA